MNRGEPAEPPSRARMLPGGRRQGGRAGIARATTSDEKLPPPWLWDPEDAFRIALAHLHGEGCNIRDRMNDAGRLDAPAWDAWRG